MTTVGQPIGDKPINLQQLHDELVAANVDVGPGLGLDQASIFTYAANGEAAGFPAGDEATVDQVIAEHVAMRAKTDAEYAAEFQAQGTTAARKQEIRDQQNGLMPREQVPMT